MELTCQLDFLLFERDKWFWGLTSEFAGKFAKNNLGRALARVFRGGPKSEKADSSTPLRSGRNDVFLMRYERSR
jgi:hypothetical protein